MVIQYNGMDIFSHWLHLLVIKPIHLMRLKPLKILINKKWIELKNKKQKNLNYLTIYLRVFQKLKLEETRQYLETSMIDELDETSLLITNPNAINIYEDYTLKTPSKITASTALVFKNIGLISFDYSRRDYASMKFKPETDMYFSNLNQEISFRLKEVNTYRIGAEILADRFSFRAGYMYEDSPYKSLNNSAIPDNDNNIDDSINGLSLGIGYKLNQTTIDLSLVKIESSKYKRLYDTGLTNQVNVKTENTAVTISISTIF